ncbi:MAG: hypothetical protein A2Y56_08695 [Candidatus Aminicenantes bacterium RBG_13_63_10]|nr:MAG: hypothetical protein A2Y56_08695 [Candidatus Aminicenantes bacterium RBG_13_63_10]
MAFLGLSLGRSAPSGRETFRLGPLEASPGESVSGFLSVPERGDPGAVIPLTVMHGLKPGPVLALVAGVHGYEYPPILALYRLKEMIDPRELAGTVIMVHVANVPAFLKRIIYYNPFDWKNLNRVFPGDPEGSFSQRLAHVLTRDIVNRCDALVDMHCGDGNEALLPYSYWMISGREDLDGRTKDMVLAFGLKHIIIDITRTRDPLDSKYLGNTAVLRGKPAITTESGLLGGTEEKYIALNVRGVLSVMRHLRMLEGSPEPAEDPVWIDHYEVLTSPATGLFQPLAEMGHWVKKGQRLGIVSDLLGRSATPVAAPFDGILLYIIATPPISQGEPVAEVGRIKE